MKVSQNLIKTSATILLGIVAIQALNYIEYIEQSQLKKHASAMEAKRILFEKSTGIKTTIDANVPILMQWIVSSPERLNKEAEPERHPLPNTQTFPHRQRLVNMAKVEPDRLICLYYLGDTLNEEQNKQMQDLEKLAPNIRAIDFNKLDWSEYDFEFNTSMLSIDDEGKNIKMTEYLKLTNTDNRLGFRLDMMRLMMLLKCPKAALLELNKVGTWNKSIGEGGMYFDFDHAPNKKMGDLQSLHGFSAGFSKHKANVFNYYYGFMATTTSNHPVLANAHNNLKNFLDSSQTNPYKEFLHDVDKYHLYDKNLFRDKKTAPILFAVIGMVADYDKISNLDICYPILYFFDNYGDYRQDINNFIQKNTNNNYIQEYHLKPILNKTQPYLAYIFIGNSLGKFIFERAPEEIKIKVKNASNILKKYNLIHKFSATKDNIFFLTTLPRHGFAITDTTKTKNKKCRSWVISENPDINKNFGSNTTYTEIFDMMYKAPELEIENSISANLEDVKLEQNKDYHGR